ncbi:MAG: hypothetical protein AAF127_09635 [Pseudomonadota bacterium]
MRSGPGLGDGDGDEIGVGVGVGAGLLPPSPHAPRVLASAITPIARIRFLFMQPTASLVHHIGEVARAWLQMHHREVVDFAENPVESAPLQLKLALPQ